MFDNKRIAALIPAYNEAAAIGRVVTDLLALRQQGQRVFDTVIVCDNASTDATAATAEAAGATVVFESRKGYGAACLQAISAAGGHDLLVFVDGDHSADAADVPLMLAPFNNLCTSRPDLVIGSRTLGQAEPFALTPQQRWGNWLATRLISVIWRQTVTDLGPLRAIRASALEQLGMRDTTFGWTVEMQTKAFMRNLRVVEVPVRTRARIGHSKISGTLSGTVKAGYGILSTVAKYAWLDANQRRKKRAVRASLPAEVGRSKPLTP